MTSAGELLGVCLAAFDDMMGEKIARLTGASSTESSRRRREAIDAAVQNGVSEAAIQGAITTGEELFQSRHGRRS